MSDEKRSWSDDVLNFWFKELTKEDWFASSKPLDETITKRFTDVHTKVSQYSDLPINCDPELAVAAIIVLDQFSRNMFRGSKEAFAFDPLSLHFAKQALERHLEATLDDDYKHFLFMPFMHSENRTDHIISVDLFTQLGRAKHAIEHAEIINKFGRYPHRNEVIGRVDTEDEMAYLKNAKRFGQ